MLNILSCDHITTYGLTLWQPAEVQALINLLSYLSIHHRCFDPQLLEAIDRLQAHRERLIINPPTCAAPSPSVAPSTYAAPPAPAPKPKRPKPKRPKSSKPASTSESTAPRERERMTFARRTVSEAHLRVLYCELVSHGWIRGQEPDFQALFSGQLSDVTLVWTGRYGRGTLRFLLRQMVSVGLIAVPRGFSLDHIIEGHFNTPGDTPLTDLKSSGPGANAKAKPFIAQCLALLRTDLTSLSSEALTRLLGGIETNG